MPTARILRRFVWLVCALMMGFAAAPVHAVLIQDSREYKSVDALIEDCVACHSFDGSNTNDLGPDLRGVFGRRIASVDGYVYSDALSARGEAGGVWDRARLMSFLENPAYSFEGNSMLFQGIRNFENRRRLVDWLEVQGKTVRTKATPNRDTILSKGDPVQGVALAYACRKCHRLDPQRSYNIELGPDLFALNFSADETAPDGVWTPVRLNRFFLDRRRFKPGSHLVFFQLDTAKKRADLIAYLAQLNARPQGATATASQNP